MTASPPRSCSRPTSAEPGPTPGEGAPPPPPRPPAGGAGGGPRPGGGGGAPPPPPPPPKAGPPRAASHPAPPWAQPGGTRRGRRGAPRPKGRRPAAAAGDVPRPP